MIHHPASVAVVIGIALTLIVASAAAPRVAGIRPNHALLHVGMGLGGLLMIPFFILTLEAFIR